MRRIACLLAVAAVGVGLAYAQPDAKPPSPAPEKGKRFVYLVRYGAAKDLATTLGQHFRDEPGLQLVPEPTANALLITAPTALSEELLKVLDQLDRRPRQVVIDVVIAEMPLDEKDPGFEPAELSGPSDTVLPKVEALARKAKVNHLRRFQVAALENQRSLVQVGATQPYVTGVGRGAPLGGGAGGPAPVNTVAYRDVGTLLGATPRISPDGTITVELQLDESRMHTSENGIALGGGAVATEFVKTTLGGKVSMASGRAILAEGVKTEAKSLKIQSLVVVAAKVVEK